MDRSNVPPIADVAFNTPAQGVESENVCDTAFSITLGQLPDDALLTRKQTAVATNTSLRFLEEAARKGSGPPMIRLASRTVRYRVGAVREWLASRVVRHTQQDVG